MLHLTKSSAIKKYREFLNITQKELARGRFSIDTIQLLEKGKRKLTIPTAGILVDNFNKSAEEKGIVLNLSIKDLMISEKECMYENCVKELNKIDKEEFYIENYLDILKVTEKYNFIDIEERATYTIGYNFYNQKNYEQAIKYLKKSLELKKTLNNHEELLEELSILLNRIGASYLYLKDYPNAFYYLQRSYTELKIKNSKNKVLREKVLFNLCLSLVGQSKYELSLKYIDKLIDITDHNKSLFIDAITTKANILSNLEKNQCAINLYTDILPKAEDKRLIYYNLSIIYSKIGDMHNSSKYAIKLIEMQSINQPINTANTHNYTCKPLIHLGNLYDKKNLYKEALLMYDKAIFLGKKFHKYDEIIECYENIFECYKKQNKLNLFQIYIENLFMDLDLFLQNNDLINRILILLVQYLNSSKNLDGVNNILNKIRGYKHEKNN